jgi:23S rRNA (cytidine1920-2'-O)/16S rRNA (cytidine1409-2'-O)-methyltransferase
VIERVILFAKSIGFGILHLDYSPIKGPEGNIEYLLYITKDQTKENKEFDIKAMVEESHRCL